MIWHNFLPENTNHNLSDEWKKLSLLFIETEEKYQILHLNHKHLIVPPKIKALLDNVISGLVL